MLNQDAPSSAAQRAIIAREVNSLESKNGFAPITLGCPSRTQHIDFSVFEKSPEERAELRRMKKAYRLREDKTLQLHQRYQF
jgi:hypothetical protein